MVTVLIGADEQLGCELRQAFSDCNLVLLTHASFELTDQAQVKEALHKYRPSLILNTTAYHPPRPIQGETVIWYDSHTHCFQKQR